MKIIPLINKGIKVKEGRSGLFDAVCNAHLVKYEKDGESVVLVLNRQTILDGLFDKLVVVLDIPEGIEDKFKRDVLSLEGLDIPRLKF